MQLDNNYWNGRYDNGTATWDVGHITTPLKEYFDQLTDKDISILIPGCGNSHEAEYLLQKRFFKITLVDFAVLACTQSEKKLAPYLSKGLKIICSDIFDTEGQYDLIIEQTFFCALEPALRKKYVEKMYQLLKPQGKLAGVLFNRQFDVSPPFGGSEEEYHALFQPKFTIAIMEKCTNSIPPRRDAELFVKLVKKD